jgi:probable HAF family extracellular repeat protein
MRIAYIAGVLGAVTVGLGFAGPVGLIQDLGTLGGGNATAYAINELGQAAGWSTTSTGGTQAFLSGSGGLSGLSTSVAGADSYAFGINESGVVTGTYYVDGQGHGAIWSGSTVTDLGANTFGQAINDAGAVVGGSGEAFVYSGGSMQILGYLPGGNWSAAYGINDLGEVVGYGTIAPGVFRAFYWNGSGLVPLGTLGGGTSYATGVNDAGVVVGGSATGSGYMNAFLYSGGSMNGLGTLGGTTSYAYGVNDNGYAVGYSTTADGSSHAFVYMNGTMIDLNSLLPVNSGWDLLDAYAINGNNQIAGTGLYGGEEHAFVLSLSQPRQLLSDPAAAPSMAPEARSSVLTFSGICAIGLLHLLRRRRAAAR